MLKAMESKNSSEYVKDLPWKFEAETMNIAEAVGLGATINYKCK